VVTAARETIVQLDERRQAIARRRAMAAEELSEGAAALDAAHRALGAALAALALLAHEEPYPVEPDPGTDLIVEQERIGGRTVVRVEGEIDIATSARLGNALAAAAASGADEVWVDLVGVGFIDSTGISTLLRATQQLPGPRRMAVICPEGPARRALELCGIGSMLALYATPPSAASS
jgi:anti-sigma B factor antagonist